jgi:CDP-glycerol glycerophosphotransferase
MTQNIVTPIREKSDLHHVAKKVKYILSMILYYCCSMLKLEGKVLFQSYGGRTYTCKPQVISERLHKVNPEIEIVRLFLNSKKKSNHIPSYIEAAQIGSIKAVYEIVTAKLRVDNIPINRTITKRKYQTDIQTWHGDRGFKRVLDNSQNIVKRMIMLNLNFVISWL